MKNNNKFKILTLITLLFILSSCGSSWNATMNNFQGNGIEYYYNQDVGFICFTDTDSTGGIYCMESSKLHTTGLTQNKWGVFP